MKKYFFAAVDFEQVLYVVFFTDTVNIFHVVPCDGTCKVNRQVKLCCTLASLVILR